MPENKTFNEVKDFIMGLMSTYGENKEGEIFNELTDELQSSDVRHKKKQDTRWARALLAAMAAFLRNAGTFYILLGREEAKAAAENKKTRQKEIRRKGAENWMVHS